MEKTINALIKIMDYYFELITKNLDLDKKIYSFYSLQKLLILRMNGPITALKMLDDEKIAESFYAEYSIDDMYKELIKSYLVGYDSNEIELIKHNLIGRTFNTVGEYENYLYIIDKLFDRVYSDKKNKLN